MSSQSKYQDLFPDIANYLNSTIDPPDTARPTVATVASGSGAGANIHDSLHDAVENYLNPVKESKYSDMTEAIEHYLNPRKKSKYSDISEEINHYLNESPKTKQANEPPNPLHPSHMVGDITLDKELENEFNDWLNGSTSDDEECVQPTTFIELSESQWADVKDLMTKYLSGVEATKTYSTLTERSNRCKVTECPFCGNTDVNYRQLPVEVISIGTQLVTVSSCNSCSYIEEATDFIKFGFFPLLPQPSCLVGFDFSTLTLLSALSNYNPLLSNLAVVNSLNFTSRKMEHNNILRPEIFNSVIRQWKRLEAQELRDLKDLDKCPACDDTPHCIHIDGNAKLYRYSSAGRSSQMNDVATSSIYLSKEYVAEEVGRLRSHKYNEGKSCSGVWQAAKTKGRSHKNKDETGVMLATCRHMLVLKALDMSRGEIYEYPYILQKEFPTAQFVAMDTICKYWPWLQQVDKTRQGTNKPLLSSMHGRAHLWACQMKWGAKFQTGSGLSTGETTELVNSYLSRFGVVTRHMTAMSRRERLSQAFQFWNLRKIIETPNWIANKIERLEAELPVIEDKFSNLCSEKNVTAQEVKGMSDCLKKIGASTATKHQRDFEQLASRINILETELKYSGPGKQREKQRKKLSSLHDNFNTSAKKYTQEQHDITYEQLRACLKTMKFPWSPNVVEGIDIELINAHSMMQRSKEVLGILYDEKNHLMKYIVKLNKQASLTWVDKWFISATKKRFRNVMFFSSDPDDDTTSQASDSHTDSDQNTEDFEQE